MTVEKFCGCGKLETGGMVVGILGLIAYASLIVLFFPLILKGYPGPVNDEQTLLMVVALIFVTSFFGMVFGSVILIIGTQKRNPHLVFVWLVLSMIAIIATCLTFVFEFKITTMWFPALQIYWWICIYALFKMLKREKLEQQAMVQPEPSLQIV